VFIKAPAGQKRIGDFHFGACRPRWEDGWRFPLVGDTLNKLSELYVRGLE